MITDLDSDLSYPYQEWSVAMLSAGEDHESSEPGLSLCTVL